MALLSLPPAALPLLIEETFSYLQDWIAFLLFCLVRLGGSVVDLDLPRRQRQQTEKLPPQGRGPGHWGERREALQALGLWERRANLADS